VEVVDLLLLVVVLMFLLFTHKLNEKLSVCKSNMYSAVVVIIIYNFTILLLFKKNILF